MRQHGRRERVRRVIRPRDGRRRKPPDLRGWRRPPLRAAQCSRRKTP